MAKKLKEILATEVAEPKSPDERRFKDKHIVVKHKDRNGNDDDVFNAKKIKVVDRKKEMHGYAAGEDEDVYEEKKKFSGIRKQVDEAVAGDVYDAHHNRALKSLANMAKHVEKHKKICTSKGKEARSWHADHMKNLSRQLEDMEHSMANTNEWENPPAVAVAKSNS